MSAGRLLKAAAVAAFMLASFAGHASAATISGLDTVADEALANGVCSLRNAVEIHNDSSTAGNDAGCAVSGDLATDAGDTILLESGDTYLLSGGDDTANLIGDLDVNAGTSGNLVIQGVDDGMTETIQGSGADRVIQSNSSPGLLTLSEVTVTGGVTTGNGGGVSSITAVTLEDALVTGNTAVTGGGISISAAGSDLTLSDGSVSVNTATGTAGGINLANGAALVSSGASHIDGNTASGEGGGVRVQAGLGDITLGPGTTVSDNNAVFAGGGIRNNADGGVFLDGVTVSGNDVIQSGSSASGGGISYIGNDEVEITDSVISGNTVTGTNVFSAGVASFNSADPGLTVTRSVISSNQAIGTVDADADSVRAGGVQNSGAATARIVDSTVSGNSASTADVQDTAAGGGIQNTGTLVVDSSTVTGNVVSGGGVAQGGGFYAISPTGPTSVINSTFTANGSATTFGGAFATTAVAGVPVTIVGSTIADNTALSSPAIFGLGGTNYSFRASIFRDGATACTIGVFPPINSFNADEGTSCVGAGPDNDFESTAASLGPLADNGGPTETMELLGPALLLDAVPGDDCDDLDGNPLLTDQRGAPRPSGAGCEPGAYELAECQGQEIDILGTSGADVIDGTAGPDVIHGLAGDDEINGHGGADVICGGDDDDDILGGAEDGSNDTLDGGAGDDEAAYTDIPLGGSVLANLSTGTASGPAGGTVGNDILTGFEDLRGSSGGDILTGDAAQNDILGLGGNDVLDGRDQDDVLDGGGDTDTAIFGDAAGVVASLTDGTATGDAVTFDTLVLLENLSGSGGGDTLIGDAGPNRLDGGTGIDDLEGLAGDDELVGGPDADTLEGGTDDDQLTGGDGSDVVNAGTGADDLFLRDGFADTADCGVDADIDEVETDLAGVDMLTNCGAPDLIDFLPGGGTTNPPVNPPQTGVTPTPLPAAKKCPKGKKLKKVKGKRKCVRKKKKR